MLTVLDPPPLARIVKHCPMDADQSIKTVGPAKFLPILLGSVGLFVAAAYEAQRDGLFLRSLHPLDRFIQHNLDAVAFCASLAGMLGVGVGLLVLRTRGRSWLVLFGTVLSLVVLLWSFLGLSL